jgi:hypothetical protein
MLAENSGKTPGSQERQDFSDGDPFKIFELVFGKEFFNKRSVQTATNEVVETVSGNTDQEPELD